MVALGMNETQKTLGRNVLSKGRNKIHYGNAQQCMPTAHPSLVTEEIPVDYQ